MNTNDLEAKASTKRWFNAKDVGDFNARGGEDITKALLTESIFACFYLQGVNIRDRHLMDNRPRRRPLRVDYNHLPPITQPL